MAAVPPPGFVPPPLPPGWAEHISSTGQLYYHNVQTQESTYVRPLPAFPVMPQVAVPAASAPPAKKAKKEKPLVKTPVAGTPWLRVITTEGNTFYTHTGEKRSVWTVPEEIKDAVEALEREEVLKKAEDAKRAEEERAREVERIQSEVTEMVGKRKAEEPVPMDEYVATKKAKIDEEGDENDEDEDEEDEESEEEEWQREAAAQLAAEAEEEERRKEEEKKLQEEEARKLKEAEKQKGSAQLSMPERVDLSLDEAKALFKTLLREKDINPLHPWDTSLPLFVSDPRYVLLPSVSARREAFDEYCRDRARELRQSKVKVEKEALNPQQEFERLLKEEVKSTRTSWTEWRRQWKKDRRFYGWGRDDREREKRFRGHLKELGEQKRAAAQKAEADFFALLRESGRVKSGAVWKEIKKNLTADPRYDAVGSSSLREELFNTYIKAGASEEDSKSQLIGPTTQPATEEDGEEQGRRRKERKERAVKEREEKVKAERTKLEAEIGRSKLGLTKEEGELEFRTMLVDAIRDPQVSWDSVQPQLRRDPRFVNSPLPVNQQLHLFHAHVNTLRVKHLTSLHALFASHAPGLDTPFTALPVASLLSSLPAIKLGYEVDQLEHEYEKWQRERTHEARLAFDQMLNENSFVEFWGRLGKIGGKGVDASIKYDDIGEDTEEDQVDMKALAKSVDLREMIKVLKNDKRYLVFDHVPEQRERWLRDYLSRLSAPTLSVHVPENTITGRTETTEIVQIPYKFPSTAVSPSIHIPFAPFTTVMTIDDRHPHLPATPGDSRSPCPALNALANHGYLPHDGRSISPSQLVAAIRQVYGLSWAFATLLAYGGAAKCGHADGLSLKLDLHDLAKHNVIEHDGSLVHDDTATGQTFAPTNVDPNLIRQLLETSDSSHLSLRDLCRAQVRRQAASRPIASLPAYVSKGELDLIYRVFGVARGSESASGSPAEEGELVVPKAFLEEWLGHERLPEGWDGPLREVGVVALVEHVKQISNLETEIKSTGKSGL